MKAYLGFALGLLFPLVGISPAREKTASALPEKLSAPVVYEDLMLILSTRDGVAAVVFVEDIVEGVAYRYRFLAKGTEKEQTGEGKVFEKYERAPTRGPHGRVVTGALDKGSQLFITAGPTKLEWSYSSKGRGWVYFRPEEIRVQIANAKQFATCDLKRFAK
jgi:hypothetical protein